MSDMIERVAKAICNRADDEFEPNRDFWLPYARAAIEAMPDLQKLQEFAAWVETWVSNPVGAYSVQALDGLFAMTRERLAALSQDTHSLPLKPQEAVNAGIGAPPPSDAGTNSDEARP
jgi:hypothetical protein